MKATEQIFFSLIRSAVGTGRIGCPVSLPPHEWMRLFELSASQNLAALVFGELSRIGNDMPDGILRRWKGFTDYSTAKFEAQLIALTHLSQFLEGHGIRVMVLKGLGLALLYPQPQVRECSDVDIFCFGEYERVNGLLLQAGMISGIEEENDKHCSFSFDGVNIENHRYFSEYVNRANVLIGEKISCLSETDLLTDNRTPGIYFPGVQMGALHLMMHTLSHLAWSGISVRHLLDCGLFFNKNKDAINRDSLIRIWKDSGTADAAFSLFALCESLLGLETGMADAEQPRYQKTSETIRKGMLNPFSSSAEVLNPIAKFARKYKRFRFRSVMHPIVYGEPFPDSFWKSFAILNRWTSSK